MYTSSLKVGKAMQFPNTSYFSETEQLHKL